MVPLAVRSTQVGFNSTSEQVCLEAFKVVRLRTDADVQMQNELVFLHSYALPVLFAVTL